MNGTGDIEQAKTDARSQAQGDGSELGYHSTEEETPDAFSGKYIPPELPEDKKGKYVYQLAVFSDDGCSVRLNGKLVHDTYNDPQALPDLESSFHVLPAVLVPGVEIDLSVEYSNVHYGSNEDDPDIDGVSLFLFLLPLEIKVTSRDDLSKQWADAEIHLSSDPIYSGEKNGDMIRWRIGDKNTFSGATFTWKAEGPETIHGPSGQGKFEWRISDGDDDPSKDWIDWKPGKYEISCKIQMAEGNFSTIKFEQDVGVRTIDLVAIGWINPNEVPLSASGVSSDVLSYYPENGIVSKIRAPITALHILLISRGSLARPTVNINMTTQDKLYILNWMFKYGANSPPPDSFDGEEALENFKKEKTNYKLYNRFQVKYLVNEDGTEFKDVPIILKSGTTTGSTIDPVSRLIVFESTVGNHEGAIKIKGNKLYYQTNDGSPDDIAVGAFNTLRNQYKWSHIGSSICFGVDHKLKYDFLYQKYPTYNLYEQQKDGEFKLVDSKKQAARPRDNFSTDPYDPPLLGPAPFIIEE